MRAENKSLKQYEEELGEPLSVQTETVNSDLRQFYGRDRSSSTYGDYLDTKYSNLFGDKKQNKDHTVVDYLESAEMEAVRNAAEHGLGGDIDGKVIITRKFYQDRVLIIVENNGLEFDYEGVINRNLDILRNSKYGKTGELSAKDIDNLPFYSTRRRQKQGWRGRLERKLKIESAKDGGQGLKRFIIDDQGDFNYDKNGTRFFYVLNLPEGMQLTQEDIDRLNGTDFSDYLAKQNLE